MSFQVEDLGKNMVKLTIEATAEDFEKALEKAYHKNKGRINVQGFRKGKAPRAIIEKMYGAGIFYEDAANEVIPEAYDAAAKECGLEIVSRPSIDVTQVEKGKSFIFTAEVAVKPAVTLGQYKGVEVKKADLEVSEEELGAQLDKAREQNSRTVTVEDRAVQQGDIATIDFEGFVDGVAFEGGKGTDHALEIGSHSFIDTFEDQLVGKNIGEECEVNVTFPQEYHAAELAGKPAMFKVTVKGIKVKELPQLDDDFAQDVSEYETLEEYKESVKKEIAEKKAREAKSAKEDSVVGQIVENAQMDIPQPMIETQKRQMADEFAQRLQMQGLNLEQYMQFTGMTPERFLETLEPQALKRIQSRLVLEEVAKAENLVVSDEELENEMKRMAENYNMELDRVREMLGEEEKKLLTTDLQVQKAIDFVTEQAVEI
ncbi:MAG: trigger factor [Lachnospiraceae bacterium]|nr:trigger factor [Lachnospiraceae bacterium]